MSGKLLHVLVVTRFCIPNAPSLDPEGGCAAQMAWYIVDSKRDAPELVGDAAKLAQYLGVEAREHQGHVFVVSDGENNVVAAGGDNDGCSNYDIG